METFNLNRLIIEKLEKQNCDDKLKEFIHELLNVERSLDDKAIKFGYKEKYRSIIEKFSKELQ